MRFNLLTSSFILLIRLYQILLSPLMGNCCRFHPSCSRYAIESFQRHGALKGFWLAIRRVIKCRPGSPGGYDPIQ